MDRQLFNEVFDNLQAQYPHRNMQMNGSIVSIDGKERFNVDGYNLLYNLQRLCKCIEDELL